MSATAEKKESPVQKALEDWKSRYEDLQPVVEEAEELRQALDAHGVKVGGTTTTTKASTTGNGRRRGGRRRNGNGGRAGQFLALVKEKPGITVAEAAKELGIESNYLYRVAGKLDDEGAVKKEGHGYVPTGQEPA